jgi:hypothetical protein
MEPQEWHVQIYRPGSAVPDIAQTSLPSWRTLRTYIRAAKHIWPDASIWVAVPEAAPETAVEELRAMGVRIS